MRTRPLLAAGRAGLLILALALPAVATEKGAGTEQQPATKPSETGPTRTVDTVVPVDPNRLERGWGWEQSGKVAQAFRLIRTGRADDLKKAEALLDDVIAVFEHHMETDPDAAYICVANRKQYDACRKEHREKAQVVWLDHTLALAFQFKAFIAAAGRKWDQTLALLDRQILLAPCAVAPHCERGYVLNAMKRYDEALKAYQTALDLAEKHALSKEQTALALRGKGFALIELGRLDEARKAFKTSLELESNNRLALSELSYIRELEARQKEKPPRKEAGEANQEDPDARPVPPQDHR